MPSERHVGGLMYEVDFRGPQLRVASSSVVKKSCVDLIERLPASAFESCREPASKLNQLLLDWQAEQDKVILLHS